jgi:hypothetical protein
MPCIVYKQSTKPIASTGHLTVRSYTFKGFDDYDNWDWDPRHLQLKLNHVIYIQIYVGCVAENQKWITEEWGGRWTRKKERKIKKIFTWQPVLRRRHFKQQRAVHVFSCKLYSMWWDEKWCYIGETLQHFVTNLIKYLYCPLLILSI